jgi:N-glycosylase/DNA lyase
MEITYDNGNMHISGIDHFSLEQTLLSGQCFRWRQDGDGIIGVALGKQVYAEQKGSDITVFGAGESDGWEEFFDLHRDYGAIKQSYSNDAYLRDGMAFAGGIRVLRQPPFETLISFIISANNNVKRIMGIVDKLCARYGRPIGEDAHDFPTPLALAQASEDDIKACGAGYRARYIIETARAVQSGFDLGELKSEQFSQARKRLTELMGVGMKVADCVCLYSLGFLGAFPNDVWMNRVLCGAYGYSGKNDKQLRAFVDEKFGKYAGIAQQYLFHYARHNPELIGKVD